MKRRWPVKHFKQLGSQERPSGICGRVAAKQVRALRRLPHIAYVWIETIPGLKRKKLPATQRWFAVQARFAIQIEGQTKGRQSYEDRIVIVKATSAKEAQRKLRRNFKDYERPYLNPEGYMVKWVFESILDIYELMDTTIDPNGTEVFSRFGGRRLKPLSR
jgi:hypothetical protein